MTDRPLVDPTEAQLGASVEGNLFALFRGAATLPGAEIVESGALSYHFASPTNPMFKGVWRTRLPEGRIDTIIDERIQWFRARRAPFFFWWTDPATTPSDLGRQLESHGLTVFTEEGPAMVADLGRMNEAVIAAAPRGLTIDEAMTEEDLAAFESVLVEGFGIPGPLAHGWIEAANGFGRGRSPWRLYLGRLDGRPVATNIVLNGAGVVGVYGISTVPAARGKGVGSAITLRPLLASREQGIRHAVLWSSPMAVGVYERIGFRIVGERIGRYIWRAR